MGQLRDGIFSTDIEDEINANNVRIDLDPKEVRQFQSCELRLEFLKAALNSAHARDEWTCRWSFSHPDEPPLSEEGWVVTHYFQRADTYRLQITLTHKITAKVLSIPSADSSSEIKVFPEERRRLPRVLQELARCSWSGAKKEWHKSRTGAGRMLDFLRLVMALVIALIGLMAGAKEQLLKLDLVPALMAIFLVGFGADQIKNLLTQRPPGADTNIHH
jgi:hypothetical protein